MATHNGFENGGMPTTLTDRRAASMRPTCGCSFFFNLSYGLVQVCEKNSGNPDMVCEKNTTTTKRLRYVCLFFIYLSDRSSSPSLSIRLSKIVPAS